MLGIPKYIHNCLKLLLSSKIIQFTLRLYIFFQGGILLNPQISKKCSTVEEHMYIVNFLYIFIGKSFIDVIIMQISK